jgi:hypothetical protein
MDYYDLIDYFDDKVGEVREITINALEFTTGFSKSLLVVGSSHLIAPTIIRKMWNSYKDEEIHEYFPIDNKSNRAKGHVLGAMVGIGSWTAQYGLLILTKDDNSYYHLLPLIPLIGSGVWEIRRLIKKGNGRDLEEIDSE